MKIDKWIDRWTNRLIYRDVPIDNTYEVIFRIKLKTLRFDLCNPCNDYVGIIYRCYYPIHGILFGIFSAFYYVWNSYRYYDCILCSRLWLLCCLCTLFPPRCENKLHPVVKYRLFALLQINEVIINHSYHRATLIKVLSH